MAHDQRVIIKTRGRLQDTGLYEPGYRISSAMVSIKGGNRYISDLNGELTFPVSNTGCYCIDKVSKKGYQLSDLDILMHKQIYTESPLYILLESNEEMQRYRSTIERKIRTNYQNRIYAMQDELEKLRSEGKCSQEELLRLQADIDATWDKAEQYVRKMSERYLLIDYDFEDEFYHKIGILILNGELERADSLLSTKGNTADRITKGIAAQKKVYKYNEETIKICDYKFDIFMQRKELDSAAYYLELKSVLIPENINWRLDAGRFRAFSMNDYDKGHVIIQEALDICLANDDLSEYLPQVYCAQGDLYYDLLNFKDAMACYEAAMRQFLIKNNEHKYLGVFCRKGFVPPMKWALNKPDLMPIYIGMANCLAELSVRGRGYNKKYIGLQGTNYAFDLYWIAIEIGKHTYGIQHESTLNAHYEFAAWQNFIDDVPHARRLCKQLIKLVSNTNDNHIILLKSYLLMGDIYRKAYRYNLAIEYTQKALNIYKSDEDALGYLGVAKSHLQLGKIYFDKKEYEKAIESYLIAIDSASKIYGEKSIKLATIYNDLGHTYGTIKDKTNALYYLNKAYELRLLHLGENNRYTNDTRYKINSVKHTKK